jgi:hypothetical protein|uniref:Hint n=1 Tax=Phage sp. ctKtV17 TaxID=2825792 RepID=A0A8S5UY86_9VIRU|nr:MAG TPA: Hint [Phage sp. ctKtV17]
MGNIIIRPDMQSIDAEVYRRYFRHCRFKGGNKTTVNNTSTYTPTPYELEMQQQEANYSKAIAPNALELNNLAMNVLKNSLGTVQVDYNGMNKTAQNQIANATNGMNGLIGSNNAASSAVNNTLGSTANQYSQLAGQTAGQLGNLSGTYTNANVAANNAFSNAGNTYGSLAQGNLPTAYRQNMENSISSALNNTIGKTISGLGNRGVLNSSVASAALNDIEKNAADSVAQQYQNNINQVANLTGQQASAAQQQMSNSFNTAGQLGNLIQQQHSLQGDALSQQAQAAQQRYTNSMNTNSQNSGLLSNLINSATTPITTASVAQEAAQTPASNLWNMSLGLNGATNNALVAAAGKGTTNSTQTSTTSGGGGGFLSGLFGGAVSGLAGGLGSAWGCFPAGTMVKMGDGSEKAIEHIEVGDEVKTDSGKTEKVVKLMEPHYNDVYAVICEKGHTNTTTTQPLMKPDGSYIEMGNLKIGTELKNVGKVQSIVYSGERRVYDLQVDGENNYIANGFTAQGGDDSFWTA